MPGPELSGGGHDRRCRTGIPRKRRHLACSALIAGLAGTATASHAGGILLQQTNTAGMGNAYAGGAAEADDASTLFNNAAGLSRLKRPQLVVGAVGTRITSGFRNTLPDGTPGAVQPYGPQETPTLLSAIPHIYYARPVNDKVVAAVGFSAPYGLPGDFPAGWPGRFQASTGDVKAVRAAAGVALRLSPSLSIGGSVTADYFLTKMKTKVSLSQALKVRYRDIEGMDRVIADTIPVLRSACQLIGSTTGMCKDEARDGPYSADDVIGLIAGTLGPSADGSYPGAEAETEVSTKAFRPNIEAGILWEPSQDLRIGARFRPRTRFNNKGNVRFTMPDAAGAPLMSSVGILVTGAIARQPGTPLSNGEVSYDITMPQEIQLSVFARLTERIEVMADMIRQSWSDITEMRIKRSDGSTVKRYPQNFNDTTRYALGASYQLTPSLKLRAGYSWEKSVVTDEYRIANLPDADRKIYALGVQYRYKPDTTLEVGFNRMVMKDALISSPGTGAHDIDGVFSGYKSGRVDMLGAQMTVNY